MSNNVIIKENEFFNAETLNPLKVSARIINGNSNILVDNNDLLEITNSFASCNIFKINSDINKKSIIVADNIIYYNLNKATIDDNKKKLKIIRNLKNNWNYYGAKPITKEVINTASSFIKLLIIQPKIFPTANGSIQFEYYDRENLKKYLEFEILKNKNVKIYIKKSDNYNESYTIDCNYIQKMNNIILEFYGINR